MSASFFIARRYLSATRNGAWGAFISWMTTGSVALGVASLIVTLSVMTGFRADITQRILSIQPHVIINSTLSGFDPANSNLIRGLEKEKRVVAWSPFVSGQVLLGRGQQSSGALLKGINPEKEPLVAHLEGKLLEGQWSDLKKRPSNSPDKPRIFLGQELGRNIGARVGDKVWMITPGSIGLGAMSMPQAHIFIVAGFIQSGLYDYDSSLAYVELSAAQKLFEMGNAVTSVGARVRDADQADDVAGDLQRSFEGDFWVRSWLAMNRNLFSALKLEKVVMFIILILVTLVASFMIVSNLLLSITQKVKEIGILRAMGATGGMIRRTFLFQGLLMGAVGTAIGVFLGTGISMILARTNLIRLPADVYYIDRLPIQIDVADIFTVVAVAGCIVLAATMYPAHRATKLDPLDAIRYG
jgi:lipoprotein-releasing system permease protein